MENRLSSAHQRAYDELFQHPVTHNLQWRELRSMLGAVSEVVEEHGNHLKFTKNGQTLIVRVPPDKDLSDINDIIRVRHFLERSATPAPPPLAQGCDVLVVINHREARVFTTFQHGSTPARITPSDPDGSHRRLHDSHEHSGHRRDEIEAFYDQIARKLERFNRILIFGTASGSSSSMEYLVNELRMKHPQLAARIIGTSVVDENHMSEDQMVARARVFFKAHSA